MSRGALDGKKIAVLIEADYRMKLIGIGLDDDLRHFLLPLGHNRVEMTLDQSGRHPARLKTRRLAAPGLAEELVEQGFDDG